MTISSTTTPALGSCQPRGSEEMKQRGDAFKALAKAIGSGDIGSAKQAFATFQRAIKNNDSSNPDPFFSDETSQTSKDLAAVEKALESGDVDAAKEAFETLKTHMDAARPSRPQGPTSAKRHRRGKHVRNGHSHAHCRSHQRGRIGRPYKNFDISSLRLVRRAGSAPGMGRRGRRAGFCSVEIARWLRPNVQPSISGQK